MLELNQDNFEDEVIKNDLPVIVDFWAEWCGPCKQIAPVFGKLSSDYNGKLKFAKLNVEGNRGISEKHEVRAIPCLAVFNKGKEVERIVGYFTEEKLKAKIDEILSNIKEN